MPPPNAPPIAPTDKLTLPKLYRRAGYHTAVIAKWHQGIGEQETAVGRKGDVKPGPLEVGFDDSFLLPSTNDRAPLCDAGGSNNGRHYLFKKADRANPKPD